MNKRTLSAMLILSLCSGLWAQTPAPLPAPKLDGTVSLEKALAERRSFRDFTADSLTLPELSQILWAAQGVTSDKGKRTAPSAMATYPLALYAVVKRVNGLAPGFYQYNPQDHALKLVRSGDPAKGFSEAFTQAIAEKCAAALIIAWDPQITRERFKDKAERCAALEAGHACQNALLQAQALGLGAVPATGFDDTTIKTFIGLATEPLYIIPVGRK
jgi:SagB-type dehydrogenase family enzyme